MAKRHLGISAAVFGAGLLALAAPAAADATARYRCDDGAAFTALFTSEPGAAALSFADGRSLTLPQALSADGGRYADDANEFWIKGKGASLTMGGKTTTCKAID